MSSNRLDKLIKERTTLRTWFTVTLVGVLGITLLTLAEISSLWMGYQSVQSVVRDIGSLMLASIAVSLLWELAGKRAFLDELLMKVRLSEEIKAAGILKFNPSFHDDIDWENLFKTATEIDIFFISGRTWRRIQGAQLAAAAKRHVRIRVLLPDPEDKITISEIARRINEKFEDLQKRIIDAKDEFISLRTMGANVDVWLLQAVPLYSFYRFDHTIILSLYSHKKEPKPAINQIPAFILGEGDLYQFIQTEYQAMTDDKNGLAKRVPNPTPIPKTP